MDVVSDAISTVRIGRPSSDKVRISGSWCTRLAAYDGAGFHVVLKGSCWLLPDDGSPVSLGPGDAVLLPHGTGHVIADAPLDAAGVARAVPFDRWTEHRRPGPPPAAYDEVEVLCGKYRLDRHRAHPLLAELPKVVHLPRRVGGGGELSAAIELLGSELDARRPGTGIALPHLLDLLLIYMIRSWIAQSTPGAAGHSGTGGTGTGEGSGASGSTGMWPAALGDPVTAAALRAVHADPAAPWTNDRLAVEAGVSRPTLARRFTAMTGRPPMAYLTWWRLTLAATLLRTTDDTLATIAQRVGYASPYALSHAFNREFGTTPGRYRARSTAGTTVLGSAPDGTPRVRLD
ncbi:AraC family transcriptional regulator [Streptomyces sp. ISL-36]|uniref:AraC family transcriptional regulator n=1 Tax=Streptomyces sp. ISL-36 TaxID=2819182 RepID=UPI001BE54E5C|nr:AraC family transcriptional regulator [Streptomyces sp. ISL-36]MBT2441752.1 AraC family transcriptional regulator [Streptomyces sp. ISL-36]